MMLKMQVENYQIDCLRGRRHGDPVRFCCNEIGDPMAAVLCLECARNKTSRADGIMTGLQQFPPISRSE